MFYDALSVLIQKHKYKKNMTSQSFLEKFVIFAGNPAVLGCCLTSEMSWGDVLGFHLS